MRSLSLETSKASIPGLLDGEQRGGVDQPLAGRNRARMITAHESRPGGSSPSLKGIQLFAPVEEISHVRSAPG